jgi:hypothetical protein
MEIAWQLSVPLVFGKAAKSLIRMTGKKGEL